MLNESQRVILPCPVCNIPVGIPEAAFGKTVRCPHCQALFRIIHDDHGALSTERFRSTKTIPKPLLVPIYALLLLGVTGLFVGGYLTGRFLRVDGADYDYAYARVIELRSNLDANQVGKPTDDEWEQIPSASVVGCAMAIEAAPYLEDERNRALAAAWQPAILPTTLISLCFSMVTLLGALAMMAGRWYPLAFAGCLAAIFNVNYLCCIPGAVAGIWGLLMLVRDEVRPHFGRASTRT